MSRFECRERAREASANGRPKRGVTLLEVLIAMTILSTILLPIGMYLLEYVKGSNDLGNFHKVMNILEEKMEVALSQPFEAIPVGLTENRKITYSGKDALDLRSIALGDDTVKFSVLVETVPLEFSAIADAGTGHLDRARVEEGMKRFTMKATWGKKQDHAFDLVAYKADL